MQFPDLSYSPMKLAERVDVVTFDAYTVGANADSETEIAYSKLGYCLSAPVEISKGVVSVSALIEGQPRLVTTSQLDQDSVDMLIGYPSGRDNWFVMAESFIEICYNNDDEVVTFNKLYDLTGANCYFDTMKYGAEFSPMNGDAGNLLASGWVLGKADNTLTIGDTNSFEEIYSLSEDVKVYEIDTSAKKMVARTLEDLPVTEQTDGTFYKTANRQMAITVFDSNYTKSDSSKVKEIYYLTPQTVVEEKYLVEYDTMALFSCYPDTTTGGVLEKPMNRPWLAYTKPFEIVPGKMYSVGDNDVAVYLFNTDKGLVLLDTGWPNCGYLYWQNIEDMGFNPRDIEYICLTHGHGDHYGTAAEFAKVLKNSGSDPVVYATYEDTYGYDRLGFPEIKGIVSDFSLMKIIDDTYIWDKWLDFGSVRFKPILTPGHTIGTGSFIFEVTGDDGIAISFGYMGGYGTVNRVSQGAQRVAFVHGLRYLQQNVTVDYSLPQHMAHYPLLEINKAAEKAGISLLEAMVPGWEEWANFLERRMIMQVSEKYFQMWKDNPFTADGRQINLSTTSIVTNEAGGPYKRKAGEYKITLVDSGKVMHGFNLIQNPNKALDGIYSSNGDNLGAGFQITRDGYMHDPEKWFIQISVHVDDEYKGLFNSLDSGNGPVESIRDDWSEILRTEYFDSKDDAEAVLASLLVGETYVVNMTQMSDIAINADTPQSTFVK